MMPWESEPAQKIIIAGSRTITSYALVKSLIEQSGFKIKTVIHGAAQGVDLLAERWARDRHILYIARPADWAKHSRRAGIIRNKQMAQEGEGLIAIWDMKSRGTANMIEEAVKAKIPVVLFKVKVIEEVPGVKRFSVVGREDSPGLDSELGGVPQDGRGDGQDSSREGGEPDQGGDGGGPAAPAEGTGTSRREQQTRRGAKEGRGSGQPR